MRTPSLLRQTIGFSALCLAVAFAAVVHAAAKPNIVFIMADDLGYGDVHCLAPKTSKTSTPHADRLARDGMVFTDAHSGSSVCTPTRYGLMTGRYSWRTRLQKGVVTGFAPSLIAKGRPTVAGFLKGQGYHTAVVGKWHLDFLYLDPKSGEAYSQKQHKTPPVGAKIPDGPLDRGFDYYHGFHHARNMEAVIEDRKVIAHDDTINMLPRLTRKSADYIRSRKGKNQPFFLYVPLGSPHTPIVPSAKWQGKSPLGKYGDFVAETDAVIGAVTDALEEIGQTDNTLLIFTSDNGCSKAAGISQLAEKGHIVSAHLRGSKADIWDGGHRVPFIAKWPGTIQPGSTSDQLICLIDLFATVSDITGKAMPKKAAEDSVSFLPAFSGRPIVSTRKGVIHHSFSGHFAYREKNWKLVLARGSGGWTSPRERDAKPDWPKGQLYDMAQDVGEQNNLFESRPEVVERLLKQLKSDIDRGRSTEGPKARNDVSEIVLWKSEQGGNNSSKGNKSKKQKKSKGRQAAAGSKRPNILFIIADDQSPFDFKFYDKQARLDAPNIERLAREGMVFDGAYHMGSMSGAVCSPSRKMIMSGRTLWHLQGTGGRANKKRAGRKAKQAGKPEPAAVQSLHEFTMPAVFNRAGYDTMRTCKRGNSYEAANALFTVRHDATKRGGTPETGSEWHGDRVMEYLEERERTKDEDPFLIYFGFSHPHDTRDGTPELLKKYGAVNHKDKDSVPPAHPKQPPLPGNYLPAHPFHHGHPGLRDEVKVSGVWERRDERTIRNELGRQFACGENIDIQVGRVLKQLEKTGELENTYVIYTADHGMAIGRHGLQGKQNLYEHTWRVPYVVRGPGIKPGSRAEGNIYLLDTLQTLCGLAGIDAPETTQGHDFTPVLFGRRDRVRQYMYGVYCGGTKPGMRCVSKDGWKLIKYDVLEGKVRQTQLFNLKENPMELLKEHHAPEVVALTGFKPKPHQVNLAKDPKYADKLAEMEALLLSKMKRFEDPYRLWDQPQE